MNLIQELQRPFDEFLIKWRVGSTTGDKKSGMALAYIDARHVMDRLDSVVGAENWQVRHPYKGYCEIGIFVELSNSSYEWVWKGNGADETKVEKTKGQFSDSAKRAAVEWGIGRYLYNLPVQFTELVPAGNSYKIKNIKSLTLPDWAKPNPNIKITQQVKDEFFRQSIELLAENDADGYNEIWDEFSNEEKILLWGLFNSQQRTAIKKLKNG